MKIIFIVSLWCMILGRGWGQFVFTDFTNNTDFADFTDFTDYTDNDFEYEFLHESFTYVAQYLGEYGNLQILLDGFFYHVSMNITDTYYLVETFLRTFKELSIEDFIEVDPLFIGLTREKSLPRYLRSTLPQWNLVPSVHANVPMMNIDKVWARGYTGMGVTVVIIDDGIDSNHIDLMDSHAQTLDFNYLLNSGGASHDSDDLGHGTWMAGTIAASNNGVCITGVAYNATIVALKIIGSDGQQASDEARSFTHHLDTVDIYTSGWGPEDNGVSFSAVDKMGDIQIEAMRKGVTGGRNGKGAIYVWAAGNGGKNFDDCNVDGYVNSVYTIAINSLTSNGTLDEDAEGCAVIMASTFASGIPTTAIGDQCKTSFTGSSAGAAVASGIIALILEANPDLTWRDIQHIIVETAVDVPRTSTDVVMNGAGKTFSETYGFGALDAEAMLDAALNWTYVSPYLEFFGPTLIPAGTGVHGLGSTSATYELTDCPITNIEHVVVYIAFRAAWREQTSIYLTSPSNTDSRLLRERRYDFYFSDVTWYFTSLAFWGENPNGTWTLTMHSSTPDNYMKIQQWQIVIGGTYEPPLNTSNSVPVNPITKEISETDLPIIVGAALGAAVGFVLLTASSVIIMKAMAKEITRDQVQSIETIQEVEEVKYKANVEQVKNTKFKFKK